MKVAELSGALLDLWVAKAEGLDARLCSDQTYVIVNKESFIPSARWSEGGPIIERDQIYLDPPHRKHINGGPNAGWHNETRWTATVSARTRTLPPENETQKALNIRPVGRGAGETPLIAAMRAKVASHYGDEVPDA